MIDDALPALFRSADRASLEGQRATLAAVRWALLLGLAAATTGLVEWRIGDRLDLAAALGALAFTGSLLLTLVAGLESRWYEGRALAESVKTLAWRYAVGGTPFAVGSTGADRRFTELIAELLGRVHVGLTAEAGPQITGEMRRVRSSPLNERREIYLKGRLQDQADWYAARSESNATRARWWTVVTVVANGLGIVGGLARAVGLLDLDLLGLAAAAAGSATAWLQLKQHRTLATSYALASQELSLARSRLELDLSEEEWADEVGRAEEAMSREHTMWLTRQGTPRR